MRLSASRRGGRRNILIGCLLVFGMLHAAWLQLGYLYPADAATLLNGWAMSDWLIDYSQGFVRRGLGGWLMEQLWTAESWLTGSTDAAGMNGLGVDAAGVAATIGCICLLAFAAVWAVMLYGFRQRGWCWWLLCSPLLCGLTHYVTRKDYVLFALLALSLWLLTRPGHRLWRIAAATALTAVGILLHEAYFFWGAPLVLLAIISPPRSRVAARSACRAGTEANLIALLLTGIFIACCLWSGDESTARSIVAHWQTLLPDGGISYDADNNLGALGWGLRQTLRFHFHSNFQPGFPLWLLSLVSAYYLCTQFLRMFSPRTFTRADSVRLGSLMAILLVTLLPMLTVLSCDMSRVVQYWCLGTLMTIVILPSAQLDAALPHWLTRRILRLNITITRLLPPSRGWLLVVLLLTAVCPAEYNPAETWYTTLFYNILYPPFDWACILLTAQ